MIYRRRPSPLHAARAAVGAAWCAALVTAGVVLEHPLGIAAVVVAAIAAAVLAGVWPMGGALRGGLVLGLMVALVNPLVARQGLTVIARLGDWGPLGQADVTLEATVYGGLLGLRALGLVLCFGLYATCVDPDELLGLFRRVGFRSALTASLATRLIPVLGRDARRLADAQRCRARPAGRLAVVRATAAGALERSMDVAATLEVRGFGAGRRPRPAPRPWSRHDLAFLASAAAVLALAVAGRAGGTLAFDAYPRLHAAFGAPQLVLAAAIVAAALLPFADRRGVAR